MYNNVYVYDQELATMTILQFQYSGLLGQYCNVYSVGVSFWSSFPNKSAEANARVLPKERHSYCALTDTAAVVTEPLTKDLIKHLVSGCKAKNQWRYYFVGKLHNFV